MVNDHSAWRWRFSRFQPAAGITMSYDDLKIVEANRLVQSIATGKYVEQASRTRFMPRRSLRQWPNRLGAAAW
jgi:hypothetical protein